MDLLAGCGTVGVWGNHDFGLRHDVTHGVRAKAGEPVTRFMAGMRSHLMIDGCRFSHVEPWLDPYKVVDIWYYHGPPETAGDASRSFVAHPDRYFFVGHFHCWRAVTTAGRLDWSGDARSICRRPAARWW